MKAVTFKGLLLRMAGAFIAICAISQAMPAHAAQPGFIYVPRNSMPAAPTHEQYLQAQARLDQIRHVRVAVYTPVEVAPTPQVPAGSLSDGEVFMPENK